MAFHVYISLHQHSAHSIQHHAPPGCDIAPHHVVNQTPMTNAVINQDTGVSLEYPQLIQDEALFPIWNTSEARGVLRDPIQFSSSHAMQSQKSRLSLMTTLLWTSVQKNLKFTVSSLLWVGTSSNIQCVRSRTGHARLGAGSTRRTSHPHVRTARNLQSTNYQMEDNGAY
jgi:hypothetical protein